ncbi:MAG: prepilin peptidase [Candidatus Saccharimonadales bacterium]
MIIIALVLLGLCFGSFVNALVWRLREQSKPKANRIASKTELSLAHGRSMCVHCKHVLSPMDLVPVISWLGLGGKCRYCKKPISWQYPLVEALMATLFVISYIFWPRDIAGWEVLAFGAWLACLIGLIALVVYDIRWMLLPNRLIFPLYGLAAVYVLARGLETASFITLLGAGAGVLIGGGIFYLLFQMSRGRWIGGGDVKLGFLIGALAADPANAFLMLFVASSLGTLFILPLLATKKANRTSHIPFGPFLIAGCIITVLFGSSITSWYLTVLML